MAKYLTDRAVKAAKPDPERRQEIADAGLQGLYLVVQPSGRKSWAFRYRHAGRPRKATLGGCPPIDLKAARQRARDALDALEQGRDPGAEQLAAKRRQHLPGIDRDAFGVQARAYLVRHAMKRRRWKEVARHLGLRPDAEAPEAFVDIAGGLAQRWAELPVHAITRRMIIEAIDEPVDRGAPIAANRQLSTLAGLFNWMVARDVLKVSPCAGVKKPSAERSRDRILADDEIARVWHAAGDKGFPFGSIVRLLLLTGQRRDEVAAARWREFDFAAAVWHIPPERTKNKRPHVVQLSLAALQVLETLPRFAGGDYLFGQAGRGPFSGYSRAKIDLDARAELVGWTLHDLRRSCATGMAALGTPPHVIERILNHVSGTRASVAGIYDRSGLDAERRDALERWARHVERLANPDGAANVLELKRGA